MWWQVKALKGTHTKYDCLWKYPKLQVKRPNLQKDTSESPCVSSITLSQRAKNMISLSKNYSISPPGIVQL